jgi:hypothetical protein
MQMETGMGGQPLLDRWGFMCGLNFGPPGPGV